MSRGVSSLLTSPQNIKQQLEEGQRGKKRNQRPYCWRFNHIPLWFKIASTVLNKTNTILFVFSTVTQVRRPEQWNVNLPANLAAQNDRLVNLRMWARSWGQAFGSGDLLKKKKLLKKGLL